MNPGFLNEMEPWWKKAGRTFLRWLPGIMVAIPSIWMLAFVPPLWRDIDAYNQVTQVPGAMTILQFSPLYCFGARFPLYAGYALDSFVAQTELPGWGFFAHPILSDSGVLCLLGLQHFLLLWALIFLLRTISTSLPVRVLLAALLALNSPLYTFAHSVGSEAAALSASVWMIGCTIKLFTSHASRRRDWIWFGVSLATCILLRHINAVLAALLPLACLLSGGAVALRAFWRRGATRFPRRLLRRQLTRGLLSVIVALLSLAVASRAVRFAARKAKIQYHSTVGLTFVWRLNFLARMNEDERTALLTRVASRTDDPVLKRMILETSFGIDERNDWDPPACIERFVQILRDSGIREGEGLAYKLDYRRNELARVFLVSLERPFFGAVWDDFRAAGRLAVGELSISPFSTTQYSFARIADMPQLRGLTTFQRADAERILAMESQKQYYRWIDLSFWSALAGWGSLTALCCIFLRGGARRTLGLSAALVCVGLAMLYLTCLLSELLPRYLLPSWILLSAAALLNLGLLGETLLKRFAVSQA